ncbi:MAG: acetyl-CoA carboxylase carboxyl transferase subunit beta [Coriobacteriales bacterium]|nr:acetyl-CoA carboxylase carboxyl transferase subunit beta [Coriobacteriales bacterium]
MDIFKRRNAELNEFSSERNKKRKAKGKIRIQSRTAEVLDRGSVKYLFDDIVTGNPLDFEGYDDKIKGLKKRTSRPDAFICATGTIEGREVMCAELLPEFMMGSMGQAVGEAICRSAEYARQHACPLIIFSASGGARMQEGMFSLMQMAKTSAAIHRFQDDGGLYISVLTNPTTGGVTASFASLGDIIIAEPGALIGFAGPRVISQTIGTTLPEGFQRSEFQLEHGFADIIVRREEMRGVLSRIVALHPAMGQLPVNVPVQPIQVKAAQTANANGKEARI